MKTLVLGAEGFIGRAVCHVLGDRDDVFVGARTCRFTARRTQYVDLLQPSSIAAALAKVRPDVVINCAGVVTARGIPTNTAMTGNLLQTVLNSGIGIRSIVVCGSAAAYGPVRHADLPVHESSPLGALSLYGVDKVREESLGRLYRYSFGLPVVTARIFNPLGAGMPVQHILPSVCRQLQQWRSGRRERLQVTRLDSVYDYLSAADVARALCALAYGQPKEFAYNVGSGQGISNGALLQRVFTLAGFRGAPPVDELNSTPDPPDAGRADTTAINFEFGWAPEVALNDSIMEVLNETAQ